MLLLQEFDIEIRDKKGIKNVVADHLSRLESKKNKRASDEEIKDTFPNELLFTFQIFDIPWFVDIANFISDGKLPLKFFSHQKKILIHDSRGYI